MMDKFASVVALIICISLSPATSQPVNPENDTPENLAPLVMSLMEEVKSLRSEVRDGFSAMKKKMVPKKKKREELVKKVDMCSAGVEQLQIHLIPTTTPVPSTTLPTTMTICEAGWVKYNEHCYFFGTRRGAWVPAKMECMRQGAQLVSINDKAEQDFLQQHLPDGRYSYWIGMTWIPEKLQWLDGSDVTFRAWVQGNPDCMAGKGCRATMSVSHGWLWEDIKRTTKARYICETNQTISVSYRPPTTLAPERIRCPSGAVQFQGHCYLFEHELKKWQQASDMCRDQGFYLVSINSGEEQEFLKQTIKYYDENSHYWNGMTYNSEEKKLQWEDGSDVNYTSWGFLGIRCMTQGNCGSYIEGPYSSWRDEKKTSYNYFICETKGSKILN